MAKAVGQNDVIVPLGKEYRNIGTTKDIVPFGYNVSEFLCEQEKKFPQWQNKANAFAAKLDQRIHVDPDDPRYRHVYKGVEDIIEWIITELKGSRKADIFQGAKKHPIGSAFSNVKVGLSHEADFLLELLRPNPLANSSEPPNRNTRLTIDNFYNLVKEIIDKKGSDNLTRECGLINWVIHGVSKTKVGCCLVMQCPAEDTDENASGGIVENSMENPQDEKEPAAVENPQRVVGVTVDLVPAYVVTKDDNLKMEINEKAAEFLPKSFEEYLAEHQVYQLIQRVDCDTGMIENIIIRDELTSGQRQGFRVAKYLIQYLALKNDHQTCDSNPSMSKDTLIELYGYKPYIKSYHLRVFLLHLLVHTRDTEVERVLTGGVLTFCLLDLINKRNESDFEVVLSPPFLTKTFEKIFGPFYSEGKLLSKRLESFLKDGCEVDFEQFKMLNKDNKDPLIPWEKFKTRPMSDE